MIVAGVVLLAFIAAAIGYVIAVAHDDGGPRGARLPQRDNEWSTGLPSAPYAQRFNEQFTSPWYRFP